MQATCEIAVERPERRTTQFEIHYQTPEWTRVVESGANYACLTICAAGTVIAMVAAYHGAFSVTIPKQMVIVAGLSGLAFAIGRAFELMIIRPWRKGRGPHVPARICVSPARITIDDGFSLIDLPRTSEARFTCLQHREGRHEQRAEQRAGRAIGYAFRDAWEIWLQMGHRFERMAAVADEPSARAIVRHLQEADERAVRGDRQQQALTQRLSTV